MNTNTSGIPDWPQSTVKTDPTERDVPTNPVEAKVPKDGSSPLKVPAGSYHVVVTANSNLEEWRDFIVKEVLLNGKDVGDLAFSLAGGMTSLEIVASSQGSAIEGNVLEEDGKPVPDVPVVCIPDASRRARRDIYQQVQTDRQGHFDLRGLNSGEYQVFTLEDDAQDITDPVFIRTQDALGHSVQLDPGERKGVVLKLAAENHPY